MRYRQFALENPEFYGVMFGGVLANAAPSSEVDEHAGAAFGALVTHVAAAIDAAGVEDADPFELAHHIWSSVHGAVSLELAGLALTADPRATYEALLQLLLRGLQPSRTEDRTA